MWYLIANFWLWLLVALVIGAIVGWMTWRGQEDGFLKGLIPWFLLIGGGTAIAAMRWLPNGMGFWLDLAMLLTGFYFIGCFLGYLWRSLRTPAPALAVAGGAPVAAARLAEVPPARKPEVAVEPAKTKSAEAIAPAPEQAITGLSGPRGGKADDLTKIYGIDAETEKKLNGLGIYHYDQLASMTPEQRRWLFGKLGYEGRFPSWWWRWRYDAEQILVGKAAPVAAAPVAAMTQPAAATEPVHEGVKPTGLTGPRGGKADDLKRIRGIGKQNEGRLHALGIWHFDQIGAWSKDEALWVGSYLAFPGRIEREDWIAQAKVLAAGGVTDFAKRVDKGEVATSRDNTNDDGQSNVAKLDQPITKPPKK